MYMNIVQHYNCQSQNNFSTLNITLKQNMLKCPFRVVLSSKTEEGKTCKQQVSCTVESITIGTPGGFSIEPYSEKILQY